MAIEPIKILSTRQLSDELLLKAASLGIDIRVLSFIDTAPIQTIEVVEEVEQSALMQTAVVFTSGQAIEAVSDILFGIVPDWKIYCLSGTTRKLAARHFGEENIEETAENAAALAGKIMADESNEEVIFFCGDQRRDELPQILRTAELEVTEIVVYETIATPHKLNEVFAAVLFFSPSAVESFFTFNKLASNALAFAIGATTAAAVRLNCSNTIITSEEPGKEQLVAKAIEILGQK